MNRSSSWIAVLPSLVIPICLGMSMYLGLCYAIESEQITNDVVLRYLTGHPVSKVTVGLFFVGLSSLLMIGLDVLGQFRWERRIDFHGVSTEEETSGDTELLAEKCAKKLLDLPKRIREHYLWQRLYRALKYIDLRGEVGGVDGELKYLSEIDSERQHLRYSLVRILIWATPMLGFLGTVLGISQALGGINVGPDNNFQQMMDGLRGSLYIAFDTTALALTLSMILMFSQFLVDRFEVQLLQLVDHRARGEIARQFDMSAASTDEFAGRVADITKASVEQQTELWRKSIQSAEQAWESSLTQSNAQVRDNLSEALEDNLSVLAHCLGEAIERADLAMSHRWNQWQITLSQNARLLADHQAELAARTRTLVEAISLASDEGDPNAQRVQGDLRDSQGFVFELETPVTELANPKVIDKVFEDQSTKPKDDQEPAVSEPVDSSQEVLSGEHSKEVLSAEHSKKTKKNEKRHIDDVIIPFPVQREPESRPKTVKAPSNSDVILPIRNERRKRPAA